MIDSDVNNAMKIMTKVRPSGVTPLTNHIREIYTIIASLKSSLQTEGKRVVVVLATDGLPTNDLGTSNDYVKEEFVQSLRSLEVLPVWLVIRLSTDEEEVVVSSLRNLLIQILCTYTKTFTFDEDPMIIFVVTTSEKKINHCFLIKELLQQS